MYAEYLEKNFVLLRITRNEIDGEKTVKAFGVKGTPFVLVLDPDGQVRDWLAGYQPPANAYFARLQAVVRGEDTVRELTRRLLAEPGNPEIRIKLGLKEQARNRREEALAFFREAAALDPDGTIMMTSDSGGRVSCKETADYQLVRTLMATSGVIEWRPLLEYIKTHAGGPYFRDACLTITRGLTLDESDDRVLLNLIIDGNPPDPAIAGVLARRRSTGFGGQVVKELSKKIRAYADASMKRLLEISPVAGAQNLAELNMNANDLAAAEKAYGPDFMAAQTKAWAKSLLDYADYWRSKTKDKIDVFPAVRLALQMQPDDLAVRAAAAKVYAYDPPRLEDAQSVYGPEPFLRLAVTTQDYYDYFSFWMANKSNRENALAALETVLHREPESLNFRSSAASALYRAGEKERALAVFGPAYADLHSERLSHLYEYGSFWVGRKENLESAVPALVKAVSDPAIPAINKWRAAQLLEKCGRLDEVERFFGPESLSAFRNDNFGLVYYYDFWKDKGKPPEFLLPAIELMEKKPGLDWLDRSSIAWAYAGLKLPARAEKVYGPEYAKTIQGEGEQFYYYALFWTRQKMNLASAMDAAQSAVRLIPDDAEAWACLADLLQLDGKKEEALKAMEKAIRLAKSKEESERFERRKAEISGVGKKGG